jgi:hypothetical protein
MLTNNPSDLKKIEPILKKQILEIPMPSSSDLLEGNAGYLYILLCLANKLNTENHKEALDLVKDKINDSVKNILGTSLIKTTIVTTQAQKGNVTVSTETKKNTSKPYFSATGTGLAGTSGIIYMLMCSISYIQEQACLTELLVGLENSLVSIMDKFGKEDDGRKIGYLNGITGHIPVLTQAIWLFPHM